MGLPIKNYISKKKIMRHALPQETEQKRKSKTDAMTKQVRQQQGDLNHNEISQKVPGNNSDQFPIDPMADETEMEAKRQLYYVNRQLTTWLQQLNSAFKELTVSRRWKFAQAAGRVFQAFCLRSKSRTVVDLIQDIFGRYENSIELNRDSHLDMKKATNLYQSIVPIAKQISVADIIICIHNAYDDVLRCLESVVLNTDLNRHHLIIVDDGSESDTKNIVINFILQINATYIRNEKPLGYTKAANQGINASLGDYVVLLNSDTAVSQNWIDRLITCAVSRPKIACVGPLSNAASWQTIPYVTDKHGKWKVNKIPGKLSVNEYAHRIAANSALLYPVTNFVNGFCILITRMALDRVGLLDEVNFPKGYGEEDDFCLRAIQAGFKHAVADDCYVFHAKSKSFTSERRLAIVKKSKSKLEGKYSKKLIQELVSQTVGNEELLIARSWARLSGSHPIIGYPLKSNEKYEGATIGWLQPHLRCVGGIRRAIEMSNRFVSRGDNVTLITPDGLHDGWLTTLADVTTIEQAKQMHFDVLILSDPNMVEYFYKINAEYRINYHLAPYMLYRANDKKLAAYYSKDPSVMHVANSSWTAEQVRSHCGIEVSGIFPGGIDKLLFRPHRIRKMFDVVCYGSLRPHKGTKDIEIASRSLKMLHLFDLNLKQEEIARQICSGRIFVSGCWHEGFNFCPLESMACGVPVAMTDCGGSREYAVNGKNALVVPPKDKNALAEAIKRLITDTSLRLKLIENGLETAWKYDWDSITTKFYELIHTHIAKR